MCTSIMLPLKTHCFLEVLIFIICHASVLWIFYLCHMLFVSFHFVFFFG